MTARAGLDTVLQEIGANFLRMHSLVLEQLTAISKAGRDQRVGDLSASVRRTDDQIDKLELTLEDQCLHSIARHQPVASDLRFLMLVFKSLTDLERAGDYAVHVADDLVALLSGSLEARPNDLLPLLAQLVTMLERLSYAFAERDREAAASLVILDDEVDALYEQLQRSNLTRILENPRSLPGALQIARISRSLERLGHHLTNIAERLQPWLAHAPR